jgi:glucosamine--fructose-6-phosphate aminotransferase (isomerizing)
MSDRVVYLNCGPEIGVAATKSFIAQLSIFYLLAYTMVNRFDEGIEKLIGISNLIESNLPRDLIEVPKITFKVNGHNDFYFLARGINFAIAGEGALKLKEISYVHAEGMPAGELKHGTLALIEDGTPIIAICPCDYTYDEIMSNIAEAKARGAFVTGISNLREPIFDRWIELPTVEEIFYPLVTIIPLQLFAYHSALARGLDPDKPRNLAKSVTVK